MDVVIRTDLNTVNGTFEPQIIEKRQTRTDDIENRILAMYAKGMSTRDRARLPAVLPRALRAD